MFVSLWTGSSPSVTAPAEIPEHVQEQLLSDYEKELQTDKSLQKELGDVKITDADEKSE